VNYILVERDADGRETEAADFDAGLSGALRVGMTLPPRDGETWVVVELRDDPRAPVAVIERAPR
jgi:hypothetical protein